MSREGSKAYKEKMNRERKERNAENRFMNRWHNRKVMANGLIRTMTAVYLDDEQFADLELYLYLENALLSTKVKELLLKWMDEKLQECHAFKKQLIDTYNTVSNQDDRYRMGTMYEEKKST